MDIQLECAEKSGPIVRRARDLERTPLSVLRLHEQLWRVKNFLHSLGKLEGLALLFNPKVAVVTIDDVGAALLDCLTPGVSGRIHCTFWDGRYRGRENLAREIINAWLVEHDLIFVYAQLPQDRSALIAFAKRIGFVKVQDRHGEVLMQYLTPRRA